MFFFLPGTEPASVLYPVIKAALHIDYPVHKLKVLVLDDGKRSDVEVFVIDFLEANEGCTLEYIARVKDKVHWAKAGNINNAFIKERLQGDFVLVIDADMVVAPEILQRMLPAFYTQKDGSWQANNVAWCQSPQTFCNIKYGDPLDLAQCMWYKIGILGRDDFAGVPFCGTNAVLRSSALDELGGLKYGALTEDLHSSMCLAAKGWKGRYVPEPLAVGLAPPNLYESKHK
jgi:cellulose synthase (UDP-forming)